MAVATARTCQWATHVRELGGGGVHERVKSADEEASDAMEKNIDAKREAQQ